MTTRCSKRRMFGAIVISLYPRRLMLRARLSPYRDGREWHAVAFLPVVASAQARCEQWTIASSDGANAASVQIALVVQRAQPPALADLLALAALDHAHHAREALLAPVVLT
jgi:hypothetical protein